MRASSKLFKDLCNYANVPLSRTQAESLDEISDDRQYTFSVDKYVTRCGKYMTKHEKTILAYCVALYDIKYRNHME